MGAKRQLPIWSVVLAIAAALGFVTIVLMKAGPHDMSKEEITKLRQAQRTFSSGAPPEATGQPLRR